MRELNINSEGRKIQIKKLISRFRADLPPFEEARKFNRMERRKALINLVRKVAKNSRK